MPIIKMDGDAEWTLPMLDGDIIDVGGPYTSKHRLVFLLGQHLRRELPGIMAQRGREITGDQVGITWALPHHSENLANVRITVAPMEGEFTDVDTQSLIESLRDAIREFFVIRRSPKNERPTFDIDVDYNQGAGMGLDENLRELTRW